MVETVSVDEAIKKAVITVNTPTLIIMFGMWGLCFFMTMATSLPVWVIIITAVLSFAFGWLYWAIAITRWRIWAFDNVRNVHELKTRAIGKQLIWPDGSIFEKTELRSAAQKQKLAELSEKFKQPDLFIDDLTVPLETIIRYSKVNTIFSVILGLFVACGSGYYLMQVKFDWWLLAFMVGGVYLLVSGYRKSQNREPQITISNEGIQTVKDSFYNWDDISDEAARVIGYGKSSKPHLCFNCPEGKREIDISELDISFGKLEKLLIVYRNRHNSRFKGKSY